MERILNMILRRLINKGISGGIKAVSNRGKRDGEGSLQQHKTNRHGQQQAKGLKQATRLLRRMNKL